MIHTISHGRFGASLLIYAATDAEVEIEVAAYLAAHPTAEFGPNVPRKAGAIWGRSGVDMIPGHFGPWKQRTST